MNDANDLRQRDKVTLRALGSFFAIMGVLVLVGAVQTIGNTRATLVSFVSGAILLAIGAGMLLYAQRMQTDASAEQ